MIKQEMFYGFTTIKDYRDMDIPQIIREYLLTKGTWNRYIGEKPKQINKEVKPKDLVSAGLFVYGLKDNPTNRKAVEYYCERWGHIHQVIDQSGFIHIPQELWEECDKINEEFTKGNDRKI